MASIVKIKCPSIGVCYVYDYGEEKRSVTIGPSRNPAIPGNVFCRLCHTNTCTAVTQHELIENLMGFKCKITSHKEKKGVLYEPEPGKKGDKGLNRFNKSNDDIGPLIDNKAPPLNVENIMKCQKINKELEQLQVIFKDNMELMQKINIIQKTRGYTDTYNPVAGIRETKLGPRIKALRTIDTENVSIYQRVKDMPPNYSHKKHARHWQNALRLIKKAAKYPLTLPGIIDKNEASKDVVQNKESILSFFSLSHARVVLEFLAPNHYLGKITCILYKDIVPNTCKRFYKYCKSDGPGYTGTAVGRIFKSLYAEMGQVAYSSEAEKADRNIEEENFIAQHNYRGTLAMVRNREKIINTEFSISFKPLPAMNGERVVFGRVISGENTLATLEHMGSYSGKALQKIIISKTTILPAKPYGPMCMAK